MEKKHIKNEKRVRDIYMTWWTRRVFRSLLYLKKLFSAPSSIASIPFRPYPSRSFSEYVYIRFALVQSFSFYSSKVLLYIELSCTTTEGATL